MQQEMQNQEFNIKQDPYNYMLRVLFNRWKPYIIRAISFDQDAGQTDVLFSFFQAAAHHTEGTQSESEGAGAGWPDRASCAAGESSGRISSDRIRQYTASDSGCGL